MSPDIRLNMYRNPMNLSSLLNPLPTPPTSDDDEQDNGKEMEDRDEEEEYETVHSLSYDYLQGYSAPQPIEIDGEVRPHQPSSINNENPLPPIRLLNETELYFSDPIAFRPAPPPQASSESFLESHDRRPSSSYSNSSRRHHHHRDSEYRRVSSTRHQISPSPSLNSSFSSTPEVRYITKDGKKKRKKSATGPHNNRPYTQEQVHWIRYHKEDCGMMGQALYTLWLIRFPDDLREEGQSFSSRTYRDNIIPVTNENGDLVFDPSGKPLLNKCGVRDRNLIEHRDFPFKLVDKHPEWALHWDWVSPEHKAIAQKILDGDLDESQRRKEKSRRGLRKWQAILPPRKGWYATPAQHAEAMKKEQKSKKRVKSLAGTSNSLRSSSSSRLNTTVPKREEKTARDWFLGDDGDVAEMKQEETESH